MQFRFARVVPICTCFFGCSHSLEHLSTMLFLGRPILISSTLMIGHSNDPNKTLAADSQRFPALLGLPAAAEGQR